MRIKSILISILFFTVLTNAAYSEEISKEEVKTFAVNSGGSIVLKANEGDVTISTWSKKEVQIKMLKRAWGRNKREAERNFERIRVDINAFNDRVLIREKEIHNSHSFSLFDIFKKDFWKYGWSVDFELKVPKEMNIKVECDEGDVRIDSVEGEIEVLSDEGDVNLSDIISESIRLQADEGSVECVNLKEKQRGYLKANVDEGNFTLSDANIHELDISCDEGRISIEKINSDKFWLASDEGSVFVSFIPIDMGRYEIKADEGDINIRVPEKPNLEVLLHSEDGNVRTDFNLTKSKTDDEVLVKGVLGSGKSFLKAYSEEGSIRFVRK